MTWFPRALNLTACGVLAACSAWQPAGENTSVPLAGAAEEETFASSPEAEIRARRERFNDAIVARDTTALARIWTADVHVVTSAGGRIEGRDAYRERFAGYFADREEYTYRREPSRIEVHEPWGIAAEHGRWRARWRDAHGLIDVGGDYLIQWTRVEGRWFVHAEMFAPVHCSSDGPYCRERP